METISDSVSVEKDGIIDYPIYPGQTLEGIWAITPNPNGPSVVPSEGYLHYSVSNQPQSNQWLSVSISTPLETAQGAVLVFRVRANTIQGDEVKFTLPGGIILRFTNSGNNVNYQWWDGNFHTLASSAIRANGAWHQIVMAFTPGAVCVFEDGGYKFNWPTAVGPQIRPNFDMQVLTQGASLSFDVGDIYSIPSTFAPGINTPWDYSFTADTSPSPEAMNFRIAVGGPQVSFRDGYARFAALPLQQANSWSFLDIVQSAPSISILMYRIRVSQSGGNETKVTLPGDNILRLLNNGSQAFWQSWDGNFHTLAPSNITAGQSDFAIVTLITSGTSVTLLENGIYKFSRAYSQAAQWQPGLAVQHLDAGTNVSVDIGGIRTLPSNKPSSLLAVDLQDSLLGYFPLKGSLDNAAGNSASLASIGGQVAYTQGKFGLAADFSPGSAYLQLPQLSASTSASYTLSTWVKVNNYPVAGKLTGIAGSLLLDDSGKLNFSFFYNTQRVYESKFFQSKGALPKGSWHNVVITYSSDEARLGIFIDGQIDSIYYLGPSVASASAIVPATFSVGAYQAGYQQPPVILDGAVGDLLFLSQHVHQATINMLANITLPAEAVAFIPILVPVFFILLAGVVRVGVENKYLQQTAPVPPPTLDQVVARICQIVGVPARPGAQVSRSQLGIDDQYRILLDIGGEGRLDVGGLVTGFESAININAMLDKPGTPTVTVGGPYHGQPIPHLVQLQSWNTNPGYPFVDNFADELAMIGSPLTPTNVQEFARVIRHGGEINLWIDYKLWAAAAQQLATLLNSTVEEPEEITAFKNNGVPENRPRGTWLVRRRIIAHKS